ncbi:MAG TPA: Wzz/FepE/Etk N-terminal domain-containing protein [Anaerovoracaceae bacterium]|nr:Wzz/FepE/Etk N-terminal domain-containing protein [Anaerovoracaceae bacterium]
MELEVEYSLSDIISILMKRLWIILLCIAVGTAGTFLISQFLLQKQYTASVQMYVSPNKENPTAVGSISELTYAQAVVDTYIEILKTTSFLDSVAASVKLGITGEDLKQMIRITAVNNTEIFEIEVEYTDPKDALLIADTISELAPRKIIEIKDADAVRVVDPARLPNGPSSPNVLLNTAIGALLSLVLAVLAVFLLEMLDRRVKDEDDLIRNYQVPILGVIPKFDDQEEKD